MNEKWSVREDASWLSNTAFASIAFHPACRPQIFHMVYPVTHHQFYLRFFKSLWMITFMLTFLQKQMKPHPWCEL